MNSLARRDVHLSTTAEDIREVAKLLKEGEFNVSIATSVNMNERHEMFEIAQI